MKEYIIAQNQNIMRYHDFPGKETPILFIHGLGCAGSFDYPEVAAQAELVGHRRILIDLLGSGFSDKPDDFSYTVKDHVDYLYGFVHELNLQSFIIFAHSLGGPIGIELAKRCGDQVTALVLSESNLDPSSVGSSSYDFGTCKEEDFVSQMFEEVVEKSTLKNSMWAATLSVCSPKAMHRISQSAVAGGNPSWRTLLYSLTCKRTFIFGEESLPDNDQMELERHGIHIEIVPSAGHSMAWENPKGLANAIKKSV